MKNRSFKLLYNAPSIALIFLIGFFVSVMTFSYAFITHAPVGDSDAASNVVAAASIDSMIAISTSSESVNLDVVPTASGAFTSASATVYVDSNNQTGYTLTMSTVSEETGLVSDSGTIPSISSATTKNTFPLDAWAYSTVTDTYSVIPSNVNPVVIKSTTTPSATADAIPVEFAAKISTATFPDVYKNTMVFSGTTNYVEPRHPYYYGFADVPSILGNQGSPRYAFRVIDNDGVSVPTSDIWDRAKALGFATQYNIHWGDESRDNRYIDCYTLSDSLDACVIKGENFTEPTLITGGIVCRNNEQAGTATSKTYCLNLEMNVFVPVYNSEITETGWLDNSKPPASANGEEKEQFKGSVWLTNDFIKDNASMTIIARSTKFPTRSLRDELKYKVDVYFDTLSYTNFVKTIEAMGYTTANFNNGFCADGNC